MEKEDLFPDLIGQEQAKLAITDWYLHEKQPLLIYGSSGYGKSTFAEALGARTIDTTQFRSDRTSSLLKPIKESEDGEILFFDEVHSLQPKVLESLYKIIDKGTFYNPDMGIDLPIPKVKFIFATNYLNKLSEPFKNRCKIVELQEYSINELKSIIHQRYSTLSKNVLESIVKASKGVPRTALSLAQSTISGLTTDELLPTENNVNKILASRFNIDPNTGLNQKEFMIIQRVCDKGHLSQTAIANLLKTSIKDASEEYISPLQASEWLAITPRGVVPGFKAYENYRLFIKKIGG